MHDDPLRTDSLDDEVREELEFHVQERARELVAAGWDPGAAEGEARRRFGDVGRIQGESGRLRRSARTRQRGRQMMRGWAEDVGLAVREVRRQPGFSALVVGVLALGIGFATALFSVVDGVLLRPLPYANVERLVYLWQNDRATGTVREPIGSADFFDFRDRSRSFDGMGVWRVDPVNLLRDGAEPMQIAVARVSEDVGRVLGLETVLGRPVGSDDGRGAGAPVAVLGYEFWRDALGADPGVLGSSLTLDEGTVEVVGVLGPRATVAMGERIDMMRPLSLTPAGATRSPHVYTAVARLTAGSALEVARREMADLAAVMEREDPENTNRGVFVEPVDEYLRGDARTVLAGLLAAVGVLLALTVLNVGNLLLARARDRARDAAVHAALGAGTLRLARRSVAATLTLAVAAVVLGAGVARVTLSVVSGLVPPSLMALGTPALNGSAWLFAAGLALLLGAVLGVAPVVSAVRLDVRSALADGRGGAGAPGAHRIARWLVGAQAALATTLLVGSVLLATTLYHLSRVDLGFETDRVLRMSTTLSAVRYPSDFATYPRWPEKLGFMRDALARVGDVPGVTAAAFTTNHSLDPGFTNSISIEGRPADAARGEPTTRMVTPAYFEVARVGLVAGRLLDESDDLEAPGVVVLNRTAAARYFPDGDALGSRIGFWGLGFREIVGVVEDERVHGLRSEAPPAFYTSLFQTPAADGNLTLMVRTEGAPLQWAEPVRAALASVDGQLAVFDVTTMDATLERAQQRERFVTRIIGVFALMAVVLASTGVYGVLSHFVARRRREMGIRLALGAEPARLRRMVLGQGLWIAGLGVAGGLLLARFGVSVLRGLLFGVEGGDVLPYAGAAALLLGVAFLASDLPARRAASVTPADTLRTE